MKKIFLIIIVIIIGIVGLIIKNQYFKKEFDNQDLELLIEVTKQKLATFDGDDYSSFSIYKRINDTYELHYKYLDSNKKEKCETKQITKEIYEQIKELIKINNLISYKDGKYIGLDGLNYTCTFKNNNEYITINLNNVGADNIELLSSIYELANKYFIEGELK